MMLDRALHFVMGCVVAFGGLTLALPLMANAVGLG